MVSRLGAVREKPNGDRRNFVIYMLGRNSFDIVSPLVGVFRAIAPSKVVKKSKKL